MKYYGDLIKDEDDLDDIVDNIFFYWIKNSSSKSYVWTRDLKNTTNFLFKNGDYVRNQIKKIVRKEYLVDKTKKIPL